MPGLVFALAVASAAPTVTLGPSGKWVIDYGQASCRAARTFGGGRDQAVLLLTPDPFSVDRSLLLTVRRKQDATLDGAGELSLTPTYTTPVIWQARPTPDGQTAFRFVVPPVAWDTLRSSRLISFARIDQGLPSLADAELAVAASALRKCNSDLLRSWGADPSAMLGAVPAMIDWFGRRYYPRRALTLKQQGRLATLSSVDRSGRVTSCKAVVSSGYSELDAGTCEILKRRVDMPAGTDSPEKRFLYVAVTWMLPS